MIEIGTRSILQYTTQRSTRYVLPMSIATYGSSYINLLALWKNRTSIYSALYRTVFNICYWTNQVLWVMHILRSWLLLPTKRECVEQRRQTVNARKDLRTQWSYLFSAPAESKEVERPTLLFTRLHNHPRVLCRPTRKSPPRKEHNTYRTARAQYSAQLRCVADMWDTTHFEVFCRTGHNIITDFNFISPILSGLRRPHL